MVLRDLRLLTAILAMMIVIDALWTPVILLWATIFPAAYQGLILPVATSVDIAAMVFKIATMILFCVWIYIAGGNLIQADVEDLDFTPASRIWWFIVPIACWFKPFQGMRELWNASRGILPYDTNENLVAAWWALWLISGMVAWFSGAIAGANGSNLTGLWVSSAVDIALCVVAIMLIRGIAQGQRTLDGSNLSEVFA
jgi:hypothetical protein